MFGTIGCVAIFIELIQLVLIQKPTFIFWTLMVNLLIPHKRSIHIYPLQILQPLFCMSIVCQYLVGFKVQISVIGLNAHQPPSFLVSLGLNMMMKDELKIKM